MSFDVVVSIINFRTGDLTIKCIQSVLADLDGIKGQVVVIDNLSEDGSAEQIEDWISNQPGDAPVRMLRSDTNSGFSGGHNQVMKAVAARHYLILNSDAVLRPGFLRTIMTAAEATPEAGFLCPVIEYDDGGIQNSCFRFHGPLSEFARAAQIGLITRLFQRFVVSLGPDPDPAKIQWASFACILLNGKMVDAIGPMDEGYFLYFEDVEYCLRAARAGWGVRQIRDAKAVHFRGGSGPVKTLHKARKRLPRYYYSSRTRFLFQAHGYTGLLAANLLWYAGRALKQSYRLLGRHVEPMARAEGRDIWTNFWRPLGPSPRPGAEQTK